MATGDISEINTFRDKPIHEAVAPIIWLHGKWISEEGQGSYPTINPFQYGEEIQFQSFGQPALNYSAVSWSPDKKIPMHLESGFLRIQPNTNKLAFLVAHNFGLTTVEEGEVNEQNIELNCEKINRMSFTKGLEVIRTKRCFTLQTDGVLQQTFYMETTNTPLTEHLKVTYRKVD